MAYSFLAESTRLLSANHTSIMRSGLIFQVLSPPFPSLLSFTFEECHIDSVPRI